MKKVIQYGIAAAIGVILAAHGIGITDWALYAILILNAATTVVGEA